MHNRESFRAMAACVVFLGLLSVAGAETRRYVTSNRLVLGTNAYLSASVRSADFDGDGDIDLVVANGRHWPQQNFLFFNQGRARFNVKRPLGIDLSTTYAAEVGDLDGDGDIDIAVGNDTAPNRIYFNDGTGRFSPGPGFGEVSSLRSLTLADIDGDNDLDILTTCRGRLNHIYRNNGAGVFDAGTPFGGPRDASIDVAAADLNLDGRLDLVVANRDQQANYVLLNNHPHGFHPPQPFGGRTLDSRAVVVADFNNDQIPDIAVANLARSNAVYAGNGRGGFVLLARVGDEQGQTYCLAAADMDNDGDLDLVAGNVAGANEVCFNRGDGREFEATRFGADDAATYGLQVDDFNGDGYPDIAVANSGSVNQIFLSRSASPHE